MKKFIKRFFLGLIGLAILFVGAMAYFASTLDTEALKKELIVYLKEERQRTLEIPGPLEVSFFPKLGVAVGKATLSEPSSSTLFAKVDAASVSVRLLPLISGRVMADTVSLDGAVINLTRGKDGRLNVADLTGGGDDNTKPKAEKEATKKSPPDFEIAGLKVRNAKLSWRDAQTGQSLSLSKFNLETGRLANAADGSLDLDTQVSGEGPHIAANVRASGRYRYDLAAGDVDLSAVKVSVNGDVDSLKAVSFTAAAQRLALGESRLRADMQAVRDVSVEGLNLHAQAAHTPAGGKPENIELDVLAPRLEIRKQTATGETVTASVNVTGEARSLKSTITLSGVEGTAQALKAARLRMDLNAVAGDASVQGQIEGPLAANLTLETVALSPINGSLAFKAPGAAQSGKLDLGGSLLANLAAMSARLDLDGKLEDAPLKAKLDVVKFSPLALRIEMAADRLDVDRYLKPKSPSEQASTRVRRSCQRRGSRFERTQNTRPYRQHSNRCFACERRAGNASEYGFAFGRWALKRESAYGPTLQRQLAGHGHGGRKHQPGWRTGHALRRGARTFAK